MVKRLSVITCFVLVLGLAGSGRAWTEINEPSYNLSFEYDINMAQIRCNIEYLDTVLGWNDNGENWVTVEIDCANSLGIPGCRCKDDPATDGLIKLTMGQWWTLDSNVIVWQSLDGAIDGNAIIRENREYRVLFDTFKWHTPDLSAYVYYGYIADNNSLEPDVNVIAMIDVNTGTTYQTFEMSFIAEAGEAYIGEPLGIRFLQQGLGWYWIDNVRVDWRALSIEVPVDIKPGSCRNPVNVYSRGVLPIAVLGSADLDVSDINAASVRLNGVPAIRHGYEDVGTAVLDGEECECSRDGGDGYLDLTLKFETEEIVSTFGEVNDGDVLALAVSGVLSDETPIEGSDCIVIRGKHRPF